ncbi:MAG TPA: isochorismatase family cysteine hydrolase [Mycolicibacillus parakoreensis]|nr:isochorismatase family cysteine hydrolase [Mycolicibacillus parakoreensis]
MSDTAVLVIDMVNAYRHPDADLLMPQVAQIMGPLTDLLDRARRRDDVRVVYVNDNYGDFTAGFTDLIEAALAGRRPDLVEPIVPDERTAMLTKVRHSAFYATPLEYLLERDGTRRVIVTGQVTEQCILYSALDAYVRHLEVVVPTDTVAHIDAGLAHAALQMMRRNMAATLTSAAHCLDGPLPSRR